ncbi:Mitochondrial import inner membrane translocase subunit TIM44-1 [Zea mays]|uniref:Mitochondrial import inner membrane translocase subunit TIM44-1 n=2 Tax=Zea mays TaxID=4577 RepID=A0A3L6E4W3_MAIZE|nr:Mitochondrial import inner membrane translocase subunit TIM44-2 [Zea mays]PWZ15899.1 Mitochondrial import inner membrane translocase subunit TIM44-1 [Zea mays]
MQIKGEAKRYVVKEDLKVRTKKTTDSIYKRVDEVWSEAEETSKKICFFLCSWIYEGTLFPLVGYCKYQRKKMFAAKEEVKESFGVRKEESTSCMDGSPEASKHEKTEASSHSNDTSEYATNIHTLFSKLKSTITSASPVVSGAFAKLKDTNLPKQGYGVIRGHPVYKRVDEYTKPVVTKGQEVADDVRERWETSDNPVVQKIQE